MRALKSAAALAIAVLVLTLPSPAQADEPMLAIRQVGGGSAIYAVGGIERIGFEDDTLVVESAGGLDRYAAEVITRIELLWEFSSVEGPKAAAGLIKAMHLFQNQPNPFSPETRIAFDLPQAGPVELMIYGVNGRLIRRLVKDTRQAGRYTANWDGRDEAGEKVGSGVYFYQLTAPGVEESRRMILLPGVSRRS
jgi:hypothetical protein